jgi:hypothetical protein
MMPKGMAMIEEIRVTQTEPMIRGRMPHWGFSDTGFHWEPKMKSRMPMPWNFSPMASKPVNVGRASEMRKYMIRPRAMMDALAASRKPVLMTFSLVERESIESRLVFKRDPAGASNAPAGRIVIS